MEQQILHYKRSKPALSCKILLFISFKKNIAAAPHLCVKQQNSMTSQHQHWAAHHKHLPPTQVVTPCRLGALLKLACTHTSPNSSQHLCLQPGCRHSSSAPLLLDSSHSYAFNRDTLPVLGTDFWDYKKNSSVVSNWGISNKRINREGWEQSKKRRSFVCHWVTVLQTADR